MENIRIPKIVSLETALLVYYSNIELYSIDIKKLFGSISSNTAARLKRKAWEYMDEHGVPLFNALAVNTKAAFKAWGLDIDDIEERYKKLKKLEKMADTT